VHREQHETEYAVCQTGELRLSTFAAQGKIMSFPTYAYVQSCFSLADKQHVADLWYRKED